MRKRITALLLLFPLLLTSSCRKRYEKGEVIISEDYSSDKSSDRKDVSDNPPDKNADGSIATQILTGINTSTPEVDKFSFSVTMEKRSDPKSSGDSGAGAPQDKATSAYSEKASDTSAKTGDVRLNDYPESSAESEKYNFPSENPPGSSDEPNVSNASNASSASYRNFKPDSDSSGKEKLYSEKDHLISVPVDDEFTFSGLSYRFTLTWEHWYIDNRVIYMRSEEDGGRTMVMIEVMDDDFSDLTFKEKTDVIREYAASINDRGYTGTGVIQNTDIMVLGNRGIRLEGIFETEGLKGEASIKIFTPGEKGYVVTVLSSSAPAAEVRNLSDRIMDSIIRLN